MNWRRRKKLNSKIIFPGSWLLSWLKFFVNFSVNKRFPTILTFWFVYSTKAEQILNFSPKFGFPHNFTTNTDQKNYPSPSPCKDSDDDDSKGIFDEVNKDETFDAAIVKDIKSFSESIVVPGTNA